MGQRVVCATFNTHCVRISVYGCHSFMTSFCKYAANATAATWAAIKRQAAATN